MVDGLQGGGPISEDYVPSTRTARVCNDRSLAIQRPGFGLTARDQLHRALFQRLAIFRHAFGNPSRSR